MRNNKVILSLVVASIAAMASAAMANAAMASVPKLLKQDKSDDSKDDSFYLTHNEKGNYEFSGCYTINNFKETIFEKS